MTLDLVLLLQLVPESVKALTMARLLRTAKFRHARGPARATRETPETRLSAQPGRFTRQSLLWRAD